MFSRLTHLFTRTAEVVSTLAFAAMFVLFLAGIFARYVLGRPIAWSDELIMVIFLWVVFLTEAFVITEKEQVTFDGIYDLAGERMRRLIQALGALAVAIMFLIALPTVFDFVRFLWRERTNALQWRLDIVYFCFVIYWAAVIVRCGFKLARLAGPNWRDEVTASPGGSANVLG